MKRNTDYKEKYNNLYDLFEEIKYQTGELDILTDVFLSYFEEKHIELAFLFDFMKDKIVKINDLLDVER